MGSKTSKKLGDDIVIKMSMHSETQYWDTQLKLNIEVESGEKKHSFTKLSDYLDYAKYSPDYTPEEILDFTVKTLWLSANMQLQKILTEWGFLPDDPGAIKE